MKLNAGIDIRVAQTEARFEDGEARAVRVESKNGDANSFDSFIEVMERGARDLGMTP